MTRSNSNPNPPEGRLIPASTSFGRLAGIDALTDGFGSFDWRVLGRVLAGFETMTWEDENALGGPGFRPRDLLRATPDPLGDFGIPASGSRSTDSGGVGIPTCPNPVYRLAGLGLPTHTHSVYRLCRRPRATPRIVAGAFSLVQVKWYNINTSLNQF